MSSIPIRIGQPLLTGFRGLSIRNNKRLPQRKTVLTSNIVYDPYSSQPTASSQVNVVGGPPTVREIPISFPPSIIPQQFSVMVSNISTIHNPQDLQKVNPQ